MKVQSLTGLARYRTFLTMSLSNRFAEFKQKIELRGDESRHEQTDQWANRDLIPLPSDRRTWRWFEYFGYWSISSLNVTGWQTPNAYLHLGLSVGQTMAIIIIGRLSISFFATLNGMVGTRWHIGYSISNRFTWGLRGAFFPLVQRIFMTFIWNAVQCWNGGRLISVCISAIFPGFAKIKNTLPGYNHMTTEQLIGFTLFWFMSLPMLWIPPERVKRPFAIVAIYVIIVMLSIAGWSVSKAGGKAGKLLTQGSSLKPDQSASWLMVAGITQMLGGVAAGIVNQPDYARFTQRPRDQMIGQTLSLVVTGTLVSFLGLVTTANCQTVYGEIIWNPPDLMMKMMDDGHGSFWARTGVFFSALGFVLASMFENVSANAFAGGFDLAGILPKYIDIRRGAILTFIICWVVQPWQLVNNATAFLNVLSSYSVFLAPLIGIMCCDYFLVRKQKVKLSDLYSPLHSIYWFQNGMNWRCVPAWVAGWILTLPGFIATVQPKIKVSVIFMRLFYLAFFIGFLFSGGVFYVLNCIFPPEGLGEIDEIDVYGTFTEKEAARVGVVPLTRIGCITVAGEKLDSMESPLRDTKNPSVLEL